MAGILDKDLRDAIARRIKRAVGSAITKHADTVLSHPKGKRAAELTAYAYGVVTDRELDLELPNEELNEAIRRGTQVGRAIRKGTVSK